jgi:hypothetical protein
VATQVKLGGFPGHVRKRLVNAASLSVIDQPGVLLGKPVADFMCRNVQADQGLEDGSAIAKIHSSAIAEGIFVFVPVVHPHYQWESQWCSPEPILIHMDNDTAQEVGIING